MDSNFLPEQIEMAKQAKSAEELAELAKENGVDITEDEAREYYEQLNKTGELSDDELDNVSGGGCGGGPEKKCPNCGGKDLEKKDTYLKCRSCRTTICPKCYSAVLLSGHCSNCGKFCFDWTKALKG